MSAAHLAGFLVRDGLVILFLPFSAFDKLLCFKNALGQAQQVFKPAPVAAAKAQPFPSMAARAETQAM